MTLSIIIPVYNAEDYIKENLKSVYAQNLDSFEVICVDDGSTDHSAEIIRELQNEHANLILYHQKNQGPSAARNSGLKLAKGDYVFFLDNDDTFIGTETLGKILFIAQNNDVDICVFNALIDGEKPFLHPFPSSNKAISGPELMDLFYRTCNSLIIPIWCHLYRKSFLIKHNLQFDERFLVEDILFTPPTQYCAAKALCLDINLVNYRWQRPGAITSSKSIRNLIDKRNTGRELFNWFTSKKAEENAPYQFIFSVYTELIQSIINARLRTNTILHHIDYTIMQQCVRAPRDRKCYRLARTSPKLMVRYIENTLPPIIRKAINRFL